MMNRFKYKKSNLPKISNTLLIIALLAAPFFTGAQEVYDLNRCIVTGLERNFSIKIARNQEQLAENNYTKGNAGFLPYVTSTNRFGGTLNNTNQSLASGDDNENKGVHNMTGSASVNLDVTLFRGFNVQTTYEKLNQQKQMGGLNTQMDMENLIAKIISEYYLYVQQLNLNKNLVYAVELSRERVRIDEARYLLGSSSKLELLQSMVYLNADSSRLANQNEAIIASQVRLKKLMSVERLEDELVVKDSAIQINDNLQYPALLDQTLGNNTSLLIAAKDQVISELDYKIIASRAYPYLNASTGYNFSHNSYGAGSVKNQTVKGLNYGLTLGIDIFDGFTRKLEKTNARLNIETQQYQYQQVEQEVKADLLTIYYSYENNLKLLQLEKQNLDVAKENLEIALERYKLGDLSGLELREVQKSLLDAEERLISIQYLTKVAEISLQQIAGNIMVYYQ
ncbi:TolC family protein [Maribellus sp. YY47]|uniref:TolC family protein n=1 Tax=Maribellus sp. YY47 TaxID=2929486 RepID=UPI002000AC92|nr:TolC family protein [Maribellus sp. YY47]MCK3682516.1 TolC family protein [Maribellus sp. YY47]